MRILSTYLRQDPSLRSVVLDKNLFTDEGLQRLTKELEKNTRLAHLSIKGCTSLTNEGLQKLCDVISTTNTSLFQVDLDIEQFDRQLATLVITESALNRDIQEKLRPVRVVTVLNAKGDIIRVTYGNEQAKELRSSELTESDDDRNQFTAQASPRSEKDVEIQKAAADENDQ